MTGFPFLAATVLLLQVAPAPAATSPSGFPFSDEDLSYTINWPTGVSLGEAHLRARRAGSPDAQRWDFNLNIEAAVPGFQVRDRYSSSAAGDLCSGQFERVFSHGARKSNERTAVNSATGIATRTTASGGKTEFAVPACVRDALTFLYYARRELGQGRVPPAQTVLFGSAYQARLDYTGAQTIPVNDIPTQSDRLVCTMKGPASEVRFEIFFARDAARTPLLVRAPFAIGNFSMELLR